MVCARRGDTGCFVLQQQQQQKKKQPTSACCAVDNLRVLLFLVQNCLIKARAHTHTHTRAIRESLLTLMPTATPQEVVLVQEAAADCYSELLQYAQSLEGKELST